MPSDFRIWCWGILWNGLPNRIFCKFGKCAQASPLCNHCTISTFPMTPTLVMLVASIKNLLLFWTNHNTSNKTPDFSPSILPQMHSLSYLSYFFQLQAPYSTTINTPYTLFVIFLSFFSKKLAKWLTLAYFNPKKSKLFIYFSAYLSATIIFLIFPLLSSNYLFSCSNFFSFSSFIFFNLYHP